MSREGDEIKKDSLSIVKEEEKDLVPELSSYKQPGDSAYRASSNNFSVKLGHDGINLSSVASGTYVRTQSGVSEISRASY